MENIVYCEGYTMVEMTTQKITEYLKQVSELETSVYKQTAVRDKAKKTLIKPVVRKAVVQKPQLVTLTKPSPVNSRIEYFFSNASSAGMFGFLFGAGIALVAIIMFFSYLGDYDFEELWGIPVVVFIFGLIVAGVGVLIDTTEYSSKKNQYFNELKTYETKSMQNRIKYDNDMRDYAANEKIATEKYNAALQKADKAYKAASIEVAKLDAPLMTTRALLDKLYAMDIIFPKYRNMIAMCTIYEYFASGRCTELTGPTGAYNLYEAELRQNIVINQLELVNANLEQIRQNQYILYQGIAETNRALTDISASVKGILAVTSDIAVSSRIAAYCSQVTAANATAQTAMQMWD